MTGDNVVKRTQQTINKLRTAGGATQQLQTKMSGLNGTMGRSASTMGRAGGAVSRLTSKYRKLGKAQAQVGAKSKHVGQAGDVVKTLLGRFGELGNNHCAKHTGAPAASRGLRRPSVRPGLLDALSAHLRHGLSHHRGRVDRWDASEPGP